MDENKALKAQLGGETAGDEPRLRAALQDAQRYASDLEARLLSADAAAAQRLKENTNMFNARLEELTDSLREAARHGDHLAAEVARLEAELANARSAVSEAAERDPGIEAGTQLGVDGDGDVRMPEDPRLAELAAALEAERQRAAAAEEDAQRLRAELEETRAGAAVPAPTEKTVPEQAHLDALEALRREVASAEAARVAASAEAAETAKRLAASEQQREQAEVARDAAESAHNEAAARAAAAAAEVEKLRGDVAKLAAKLKELRGQGGKFAKHVSLAKENQLLRAQVQSMKEERKRFMSKLRGGVSGSGRI